jgi:multicomponent Na+:H+ antiporter subunit D
MALPTLALVGLSVGITFVAGPLLGITDRAATDLLERTPYIEAVLGEDR